MIDAALDELAAVVGIEPACDLLGASRAWHYRARQPAVYGPARPGRRRSTRSPGAVHAEIDQ